MVIMKSVSELVPSHLFKWDLFNIRRYFMPERIITKPSLFTTHLTLNLNLQKKKPPVFWKQNVRLALIDVEFFFYPHSICTDCVTPVPLLNLFGHMCLGMHFVDFTANTCAVLWHGEQESPNCRMSLKANNCPTQLLLGILGQAADGRALQCFAAEKNTASAWNWLIWSTLFLSNRCVENSQMCCYYEKRNQLCAKQSRKGKEVFVDVH